MVWGKSLGAVLGVAATLSMAGCAATRYEPPPELAPQPPDITTTEAIEKARDAELAAELEAAGAVEAAREAVAAVKEETAPLEAKPEVIAVPTAAVSPAVQVTQRYRPTGQSVDVVRLQNAAAPQPLDFSQRLDHYHDRTYAWAQGLVEATDRRFAGETGDLKPVPAAPFRIGISVETFDRSDGIELNLRAELDIALSLPNIESRLRLFVTSDDLDESPQVGNEDTNLRAGLRYDLPREFNFDVGVRLDWPPVAFTSVKWQREFKPGNWDFYPFAKLFLETGEGLGFSSAATFDRWAGRHLFRSSTYGRWTDQQDIISWSQAFIYARVHQVLAPDRYGSYLKGSDLGRSWGVRVLAAREREDDMPEGNQYYEFGLFYRRPTKNKWLLWTVEPMMRWDDRYGYSADAGIRLGLDALFWDLARPARTVP